MNGRQKFAIWYIIFTWIFFTLSQIVKMIDIVRVQRSEHIKIIGDFPLVYFLNMVYDFLVSTGFLYISLSLGLRALHMNKRSRTFTTLTTTK